MPKSWDYLPNTRKMVPANKKIQHLKCIFTDNKQLMQAAKSLNDSIKNVLSAAKKLTPEEKQLLRLQLFSADALSEMKAFEAKLKKKKKKVKKTDDEIVSLTTSIRRKNYANAKKMLH